MRFNAEQRGSLRIKLKTLEAQQEDLKAARAEVDRLIRDTEAAKEQIPAGSEGRLYTLDAQARREGGTLLDQDLEAERERLRDVVEGPKRTIERLQREARQIDGELRVCEGSITSMREELNRQDLAETEEREAEVAEAKRAVAEKRATPRQEAIASGRYDPSKTGPGGASHVTL